MTSSQHKIPLSAVSKKTLGMASSNTTTLHRPMNYVKSYCDGSDVHKIYPGNILADPHYNKSTAFTYEERDSMLLRGLLPPVVESMETQVRRAYKQLTRFTVPISQYLYLAALRERNITLFYRLVLEHLEEIMPLIYTPVVGQACLEYGLQFRASEGMYITIQDLSEVKQLLMNWKPNFIDEVAIVVVTDGSRILGLGDLGANGMGIPIGKLSLYVAAGGFHPSTTLPVLIDVGTNNETLLNDEFYLGLKRKRATDKEFYQLIDEFMEAVNDRWPNAVVQFEDFSNDHCFDMLETYRRKYLCFNDDIQGTGAVIAAGFLNALKIAKLHPLNCRILVLGAGAAGIGVARQIMDVLKLQYNLTEDQAFSIFYLVDSKGLLTSDRAGQMSAIKAPFARKDIKAMEVENKSLLDVVKFIKPATLIGLSGQSGHFSSAILEFVAATNDRPIVFPLSNPTTKSECTFEAAVKATNGKVIFASGSPFDPITLNGHTHIPSQGNNLYAFPGLGLGAWLSHAQYIPDSIVTETAITLANCCTTEHLQKGLLYPPLSQIRDVSLQVAAAVMKAVHKEGLSKLPVQPENYVSYIKENQYYPSYLEESFK